MMNIGDCVEVVGAGAKSICSNVTENMMERINKGIEKIKEEYSFDC